MCTTAEIYFWVAWCPLICAAVTMSDLSAAHQQLQDAIQADEQARRELAEIEKRYRASQAKAKRGQEALDQALARLGKTHVTFIGLSKTQVGVTVSSPGVARPHRSPAFSRTLLASLSPGYRTPARHRAVCCGAALQVNKLRKHEKPAVQAAAEKLVRSWKSLVDQHQHHHIQPPPPARPASAAPVSRGGQSPGPSRGAQNPGPSRVLDAVRDEHGHVEARALPARAVPAPCALTPHGAGAEAHSSRCTPGAAPCGSSR